MQLSLQPLKKNLMETIITENKGLSREEIQSLSRWITKTGELEKISGELGTVLRANILEAWLDESIVNCFLQTEHGKIIGMATLSVKEADLPDGYVEVCHCIIHPSHRRIYNGLNIVSSLMREAKIRGYQGVVGRVAVDNRPGKSLLKYLNWTLWEGYRFDQTKNVKWFTKEFSNVYQY